MEQRAPSSPSSRYVERSGARVDRAADGQIPENRRLAFLFFFFVVLRVVFRGLLPMMVRMQSMRTRHVGVMAGLLVIAVSVMFGRLAVVMRSGVVMLGCEFVVAATFVLFRTHIALPSLQ